MNAEPIDPNMLADSDIDRDAVWYDARDKRHFALYGLYKPYDEPKFCRMDPAAAKAVSKSVETLNYRTAGGRLAFVTDADYIALHAKIGPPKSVLYCMPWSGSSCFDLYVNNVFTGLFRSEAGVQEILFRLPESHTSLPAGEKHIVINFPPYAGIDLLQIGVNPDASLRPDRPYDSGLPILYYGSSITQGGCCSHAGNSYQNFICRKTGVDYINLGFSGAAKGEPAMADYLAGVPARIFVCDFDHNCNAPEKLAAVHEPLYKRYRADNPDTPVIFLSRPDIDVTYLPTKALRDVVIRTYENARAAGDENVYFLDGEILFGEDERDACTIEGTHPNDLGFYRFAQALLPMIQRLL